MKKINKKWTKGGSPERGGFDEALLKFGGGGSSSGGRVRSGKGSKPKKKTPDSVKRLIERTGLKREKGGGLQSDKSGPNTAGNARHKVSRPDLWKGHRSDEFTNIGGGSSLKPNRSFLQKQKKKDMASEKRIKEEKAKAKASGAEKRAKRDKDFEKKLGKKGLADVKKLYGDWFK